MTQIIQQLGPELKKALKGAEEVWIAVAMISNNGLEFLSESAKKCRLNIITGIDLPTPPEVLEQLFKNESISDKWEIKLFDLKFYHPKFYLIKYPNGKYSAFVGSSNLTMGGLKNHIEISVQITDQKACKKLLEIFQEFKSDKNSIKLTEEWLDKYHESFKPREFTFKKEEEAAVKLKKEAREALNAMMLREKDFLEELIQFRKSDEYAARTRSRDKAVMDIRKSLDYMENFQNPDIDQFFSIGELGQLRHINKKAIQDNLKAFKKTLRMLVNDNLNIAERYKSAIDKEGEYKIEKAGQALISKVLTAHDPVNCFVANNRSETVFKEFGIRLPRGLNEGEKYQVMAFFLKETCKKANIPNMAVLDDFIYELSERFKK